MGVPSVLKLSELRQPRRLGLCQSCGAAPSHGDHHERWEECDDRDWPTGVVVVLCRPCSARLVKRHPRLYRPLQRFEPMPGAVPLCLGCAMHDGGLGCNSPLLKRNGGPGLVMGPGGRMIYIPAVGRRNAPRGCWQLWYDDPAITCTGRAASGKAEEGAAAGVPAGPAGGQGHGKPAAATAEGEVRQQVDRG